MIKEILSKHEASMNKAIEALRREFSSLRAGRATPNLLDKVMVPYYGTPTSVNQLAKVTVPEPHMIVITPWEKSILHEIEIAISKSDLGLSPNSDGTVIRLAIPQPTQERRKELIKTVGKKTEDAKVACATAAAMRMRRSRSSRRTRRSTRTSPSAGRTPYRSLWINLSSRWKICVRQRKKRSWRSDDRSLFGARMGGCPYSGRGGAFRLCIAGDAVSAGLLWGG